MIKKNTIPTILGVIMLLAGTFLGVFYLNMTQVFRIGASPQTQPKDVRVSNVSNKSATITWTTDGDTSDFIVWGTSASSISKVEQEDASGQKFFTHSISISGLNASTNYFFKISSNGNTYDNNGLPWQFTTGPDIGTGSVSYPISGSVINASGNPEKRALVYLNVGGFLESTLTSDTGNFVLQLGETRNSDFSSFITLDPAATLLEVSVQAGPDGIASAQIYPQSAHPIPPMVIGQVYDLRSLPPNQSGENPGVNLQLPGALEQNSKFNTATVSGSGKPTSVILENITEGEVISTQTPQFLGKGPGGENITIVLRSQVPISQALTIPASGSWSWTTPTNLDPGAHSITISWVDATGITRSLTRDFVVQASELPAFTASGSGETTTPAPTIAPTTNPLSSATLIPTRSPTPIPTSTAVAATVQPVPVTGDAMPTMLLYFASVAIIAFSFIVWKSAES